MLLKTTYLPCVLAVLFATLILPSTEAAECTTRSETTCRIDCEKGTLSLVCPQNKRKCSGRCFTGKGQERVARCRSGSGSKCSVSCDRGTQSLVCTDRAERCRGRCSDLAAHISARLRNPARDDGIRPAALRSGPRSTPLAARDAEELYFQQLVADVFWATGVRSRPSTVALELWETLDSARRGKKKSSVLQQSIGGDRIELHVGLRPRDMARLQTRLDPFIERLRREETARRRFDQETEALTRSLLFEDVAADDPPEPLPLTIQNRNCEGAHTFRVSSETRWIRFEGDTTFPGIAPGQHATARVELELTGVEPGLHEGHIFVECLTCPADCRVDRSRVDVYVELVQPSR